MSTTHTPRPPLMDLKQVSRPSEDGPRKTATPLSTPTVNTKNRKKKVSSLVFDDKENIGCGAENKKSSAVPTCVSRSVTEGHCVLEEITEENNVEIFVSSILDKCLHDINTEHVSSQENVSEIVDTVTKRGENVEDTEAMKLIVSPGDIKPTDNIKSTDNGTDIGRQCDIHNLEIMAGTDSIQSEENFENEIAPKTNDKTLDFEDLLLNGSHSLAHSQFMDDSFPDSTKSEEELLASFVATPQPVASYTNTADIETDTDFIGETAVADNSSSATADIETDTGFNGEIPVAEKSIFTTTDIETETGICETTEAEKSMPTTEDIETDTDFIDEIPVADNSKSSIAEDSVCEATAASSGVEASSEPDASEPDNSSGASYIQSPDVSKQPPDVGKQSPNTSKPDTSSAASLNQYPDASKQDTGSEATPCKEARNSIVDRTAYVEKVRNATSLLSSLVYPPEKMDYQLNWVPKEGRARIMHSVACSPMPQTRQSCTERLNSESSDAVITSNEISNSIKIEQNCSSEADTIPAIQAGSDSKLTVNKNALETSVDLGYEVVKDTAIANDSVSESTQHSYNQVYDASSSSGFTYSINKEFQTMSSRNKNESTTIPCAYVKNQLESNGLDCSTPKMNHDISIQAPEIVDFHSTACSPIRFDSHDVSIQNAVETNSAMCSPVRFEGHNVSVQKDIESQSVMCSPIQNLISTNTATCSPMVPRANLDKSSLASGPEVVEQCVGTDSMEGPACADVGVEARPEQHNAATDMDGCPRTNMATSMTPIKIGKKAGKKLTADDVRKQHPRVLANELETLRMENARFETLVKTHDKERKKLVQLEKLQSKLAESQSELTQQQTKYQTDKSDWQTQTEELRAQLDTLSQQQGLQVELAEAVSTEKIKQQNSHIKSQHQSNQQKERELEKAISKYKEELAVLEEDKAQIVTERTEMNTIVSTCRDNMLQLDGQLERTSTELYELKKSADALTQERDSTLQEKAILTVQNQELMDKHNVSEKTIDTLNVEIGELHASLQQHKQELEQTQHSLKQEKDESQKQITKLTESQQKLGLVNTNLQRTLDSRETDIDMLEKDLFECREIIYNQQEASKVHEKKEKEQTMELGSCRKEINRLKDCLSNLRAKEQELRADLMETERDLYDSKNKASLLSTHNSQCSHAIGQLNSHMIKILTNLSKRAGLQNDANVSSSSADDSVESSSSPSDKQQQHQQQSTSLVSQILYAAQSLLDDTKTPHKSTVTQPYLANTSAASQQVKHQGLYENKVEQEEAETNMNQEIRGGDDGSGAEVEAGARTEKCDGEGLAIADSGDCHTDISSGTETFSKTDDFYRSMKSGVENADVEESPSTKSRKSLGFSGRTHSAFAPVRSLKSISEEPKSEKQAMKVLKEQAASFNNTAAGNGSVTGDNLNTAADVFVKLDCTKTNDGIRNYPNTDAGMKGDSAQPSLFTELEAVSDTFHQIVRVASLIEKALRSSLNDVTFENEDLQTKAQQSENAECMAREELKVTKEELSKMKAESEELNGQVEEMGERFGNMLDQDVTIQRQKEELELLQTKLRAVDSEKSLQDKQISELLHKMETMSATSAGGDSGANNSSILDVTSQKEVLSLQKKLEKYRARLTEKDDLIEQISSKASKRMHRLETNWTKADAEVCRLDELLDVVRTVLLSHQLTSKDGNLTKLVTVIDGQESVSALKKHLEME